MPIHPPYQIFYRQSINFCLMSAVQSIQMVNEFIDEIDRSEETHPLQKFDPQIILNELQNIIVQGAAVSRYFWPVGEKHRQRGADVRQMYSVREDSPLKSRELRNAIEHFDERLDKYLEQVIVGEIFPHYLGAEPPRSGVKRHFFRAYFIDTGVFQILDHRFEIEPLAKEIWQLAGGAVN